MSIKTLNGVQQALRNYNSSEWVKSAELNEFRPSSEIKSPELSPAEVKTSQKSFSDFLADSVSKVNSLQTKANVAIQKLTTGESKNIHETMLLVEQADLAFRGMNQIRMKVLDAYKEVMRMQV